MKPTVKIQTAKTGYIISSAAVGLAGLFIMLRPDISVKAVCVAAGILLIVCGIFKIIGYFSNDLYSLAFQHDLAFGALSAVMGLFVASHCETVISIIHFLIGIVILLDGFIKIQTALEAKRFGLERWSVIALMAAISCLLGLMLVINPFGGAETIMRFFGFCMLAESILNIFVGLYTIKIFGDRNIIDADYSEKF